PVRHFRKKVALPCARRTATAAAPGAFPGHATFEGETVLLSGKFRLAICSGASYTGQGVPMPLELAIQDLVGWEQSLQDNTRLSVVDARELYRGVVSPPGACPSRGTPLLRPFSRQARQGGRGGGS